jgi:spore cortex formation protein SpoVR/YcgB (stage V sporulation)
MSASVYVRQQDEIRKTGHTLSLDLFDSQPAVVKLDEVVLCQCSYGMFNFL